MADISKIKTPDNSEYNLKDSALNSEVVTARGEYNTLNKRVTNYDTFETLNAVLEELLYGSSYIYNKPVITAGRCRPYSKKLDYNVNTWEYMTWNGLTNFNGMDIWNDGENIYYSGGSESSQYVLDKATSTWSAKTWTSTYKNFQGRYVWSDGENIYYSASTNQYILDKTTSTWEPKTWNGPLTSFYADNTIWNDGTDVYYSNGSTQYVLNKSTSTWETKTWNGLTNPTATYIWTDGTNIYHSGSSSSSQYVLNKSTSTWETFSFAGGYVSGSNIWTDGNNIYSASNYKFNKYNNSWSSFNWVTPVSISTPNIWTDGEKVYCSNNTSHLVLVIPPTTATTTNKFYPYNVIEETQQSQGGE